jgi:hypothetical protein
MQTMIEVDDSKNSVEATLTSPEAENGEARENMEALQDGVYATVDSIILQELTKRLPLLKDVGISMSTLSHEAKAHMESLTLHQWDTRNSAMLMDPKTMRITIKSFLDTRIEELRKILAAQTGLRSRLLRILVNGKNMFSAAQQGLAQNPSNEHFA